MKKILTGIYLAIFLLFSFFALRSGQQESIAPPDGEIYSVGVKTVEWVLRECLAGKCGTHIFFKGDATLFSKAFYDGHIFVVSGCDANCIESLAEFTKGGNFVNSKTFSKLVKALEDMGWRSVPLASLKDPIVFLMALSENSMPSAYLIAFGSVPISQNILADLYPVENY